MSRIIAWFSCGAASAVAAKIAFERYGPEVQLCYCDTSADEHPDNARFMRDIERWVGQPVRRLRHPKYKTVEDAWLGERYVAGVMGASCTRTLKREVRETYQRPGDRHVFGLTYDERDRISLFEERHPDLNCLWLLAKGGITKEDCYHVLSAAGIELPAMYRLGFNNNNCLGCCKGGMGYWNKVRRHFPDLFARRVAVFSELNVKPFQRTDGSRFGLDELTEEMGNDVPEPPIECGMFCDNYTKLIDLTVKGVA